jgi:hypothetical protein
VAAADEIAGLDAVDRAAPLYTDERWLAPRDDRTVVMIR